jgi:hypothetical protein
MKILVISGKGRKLNTTPDCGFSVLVSWIYFTVIHVEDIYVGVVDEIPFITVSLEMAIRNVSGKTHSHKMCG